MTSTLLTESDTTTTAYDEPAGIAARGTLVVLTGRGETAAAYGRFGRRISSDAYRVRVVELDLDDLDATHDRVRAVLTDPDLPAPRVLVGTDAGATYAALLAQAGEPGLDGVVLAGLALPDPTETATEPGERSWDDELEVRTACPTHRRVLTEDAGFERGSLHRELPAAWDAFVPAPSGLPTLVVHGSADPLTHAEAVLAPYRGDPGTQTWVVEGGRHDVLNDVTHRSVAATVVLFLERLKLGADLPVIVSPR